MSKIKLFSSNKHQLEVIRKFRKLNLKNREVSKFKMDVKVLKYKKFRDINLEKQKKAATSFKNKIMEANKKWVLGEIG